MKLQLDTLLCPRLFSNPGSYFMVVQRDRVADVLLLLRGRELKLRSAGAKSGICSIALGVITLTGAKRIIPRAYFSSAPSGCI